MSRITRPLNQDAVQAADDEFYANHPEFVRPDGSRIPLDADDPAQADLRREWVDSYLAHGGGSEEQEPGNPGEPDQPVQPCPETADLAVHVVDSRTRASIEGADVQVTGTATLSGVTDASGYVNFPGVCPGPYHAEATKQGYLPDPGTADDTVGPSETRVMEVQLKREAELTIIEDHDKNHVVDESSPELTYVRFGLWDQAYDGAGNIKNGVAEADNFVGADLRRFYFRVKDPGATSAQVDIEWKTLTSARADLDAPASKVLTLLETSAGSKIFVSKAVMLVTDDTDRDRSTDSGLPPPLADAGDRARGQSNHRLRKGHINGYVFGQYTPAAGGPPLTKELPVFNRSPDERKRLNVRVINYGGHATAAYISGQFQHANDRWNQIGLQIDAAATVVRAIPPAALDGSGKYVGSRDNAEEQAALNDLVPVTPDNTVTAVFVPLSGGHNAYATIAERTAVALADRYFIFINTTLSLNEETLAHELAHVLFNRFDDGAALRRHFTLNTTAPSGFGVALPDVRIYRRIQHQHTADANNDPSNDNIINWARRARGARFPIAANGLDAATATTGNNLIGNY